MIGISEEVSKLGLNNEAVHRLAFRLNFIVDAVQKRREVLKNGNLASWEPEFMLLNSNFEDLTDIVFELLVLVGTTLNQKEQGVAPPPNEAATSSDSPEGN